MAAQAQDGADKPRVIIYIDVDCFEVQIWMQKLRPDLKNRDIPVIVVNLDDVILSLNYSAKALGITRQMKGSQAEEVTSDLIVLTACDSNGRWDTFSVQVKSDEVLNALMRALPYFTPVKVERSSKDEFYLDLTEMLGKLFDHRGSVFSPGEKVLKELAFNKKTHPSPNYGGRPSFFMEGSHYRLEGWEVVRELNSVRIQDAMLSHAAVIARHILDSIQEETGFICSAGVAQNKLLAKLACSLNKPEGIAVLPTNAMARVSDSLRYTELPGLGGKIGQGLYDFYHKIFRCPLRTVGQLRCLSREELTEVFRKHGSSRPVDDATTLNNSIFGYDNSPVISKLHDESMSVTYSFRGSRTLEDVQQLWESMQSLGDEMEKRLRHIVDRYHRMPTEFVVNVTLKQRSHTAPAGDKRFEVFVLEAPDGFQISEFILAYIEENKWDRNVRQIDSVQVCAKGIKEIEEEYLPFGIYPW